MAAKADLHKADSTHLRRFTEHPLMLAASAANASADPKMILDVASALMKGRALGKYHSLASASKERKRSISKP